MLQRWDVRIGKHNASAAGVFDCELRLSILTGDASYGLSVNETDDTPKMKMLLTDSARQMIAV